MDYLTQYYKNRSEQLQAELNQLNENIFDDAYQLYQYLFDSQPNQMRNRVPYGTIPRPGQKKPTKIPYHTPVMGEKPGDPSPEYPNGMDPATKNPFYPGPDVGGQPYGPGQYPYYYNPDGSISTQEVRPARR